MIPHGPVVCDSYGSVSLGEGATAADASVTVSRALGLRGAWFWWEALQGSVVLTGQTFKLCPSPGEF